jgi:hypothetical protein
MALVLDPGALIRIDRLDRGFGALLRVAQQEKMPVRTSAATVSQVWRGDSSQANLARILTGIDVASLTAAGGRAVGALLANSGTTDVVDGHVALMTHAGDRVLTSDAKDIRRLINALAVDAEILSV